MDGDGTIGGKGDAYCLEVQTLGAGSASRSHQDDIGLHTFGIPLLCLEEHLTIRNLPDTTLHVKRHALLFHLFAQPFGDIAVQGWEALLEILYHRDLAAEAMEHAGKLHADDTGTDDAKTLRQCLKMQQARGVHHARLVLSLDGEPFRLGACGDDDVLGSVSLLAC